MNENFILVDGSSYLFRAFHALPPLLTTQGEPTGAIYGVISMLKKLMTEYPHDCIVIVFDAKGKNFRHELYPAYKAHRPAIAVELAAQIEPLHDIIRAMGFPLLMLSGVEADDVIATFARQAAAKNKHVIISTGDKDMAQLVNDKITLVNTMTNTLMNEDGVVEKFGVKPAQIVDYLSLIGDSSDNIPGVPKVGPKTAVKFLQEYGSLENLILHADEITGKVGENLRDFLPQLPLTRKLLTIKEDVPLEINMDELQYKTPDIAALRAYFKRFEFKKWLVELAEPAIEMKKNSGAYETILTETQLKHWLEKLERSDLFSFDLETTSLNYMNAEIVGFSFALTQGEAAYVPLQHAYEHAPTQLNISATLAQLKPLLENQKLKKVGQHIKYDLEVLANYDIHLKGIAFDTMLESFVFDSQATRHDMASLALKYLQKETIHYEDVAGKGAKQILFSHVPIDVATAYAAEDADITLQLHQFFWPHFLENEKLKNVLLTIEIPLIPVLADIERTGVLVDAEQLKQHSHFLAVRLKELETSAYELAGEEFNMNSPKQLQEIFYTKLKLPILKKTPTGQPSTAEPVLEELALDYPLPKLILEYRSLSKLKSTYTDALPEQINKKTGRIHTSYHQAGAATGRLSSSNPNLQNIPIKTEEGRKIRQAFIAPKNYKIVSADYSQIELRLMAHLSNDVGLLDAFAKGLDVHKATASEVFGTSLEHVTQDQRRSAKAINFGLIYGMSAFGLSKQLDIDRQAAQLYIDRYFARYPGVKKYMEDTCRSAHQQGFVETLYGRRLYLPNIHSHNVMEQKGAERAAINAPLQGTAADIIKRAMIATHAWLEQSRCQAKMIMQVHDELVFEVHEDDVEILVEQVKQLMSNVAKLSVPLVVDVGVGQNWNEAH